MNADALAHQVLDEHYQLVITFLLRRCNAVFIVHYSYIAHQLMNGLRKQFPLGELRCPFELQRF